MGNWYNSIKDKLDWRERLGEWYTNLMQGVTDGIKHTFSDGAELWWELLIAAAIIGVFLNIAGYKRYGSNTIKLSMLLALITSVVSLYV